MADGERDTKTGRFLAGNSGNGGRPKGSRNKFAEAFINDFYGDWQEHGAETIARVRATDPSTYFRVGAGLLPKEVALKPLEDSLTDEQLAVYLDTLNGELDRRSSEVAGDTGAPSGSQVH